jgi:hypothetical protein
MALGDDPVDDMQPETCALANVFRGEERREHSAPRASGCGRPGSNCRRTVIPCTLAESRRSVDSRPADTSTFCTGARSSCVYVRTSSTSEETREMLSVRSVVSESTYMIARR